MTKELKFDRDRFDAGEMPTRTRDGRKVLRVCDSGLDVAYPLAAWIGGDSYSSCYTRDGRYIDDEQERPDDLVHESRTEKVRTVWYRYRVRNGAVHVTTTPRVIADALDRPDRFEVLRDEFVDIELP